MIGNLIKTLTGKSMRHDLDLIKESNDFTEGLLSVDLGKRLDREKPSSHNSEIGK